MGTEISKVFLLGQLTVLHKTLTLTPTYTGFRKLISLDSVLMFYVHNYSNKYLSLKMLCDKVSMVLIFHQFSSIPMGITCPPAYYILHTLIARLEKNHFSTKPKRNQHLKNHLHSRDPC